MKLKLILLNNTSANNKELVWYLKDKLDQLVSRGALLEFQIIEEDDKVQFAKSSGITSLPACVIGPRNLIGTTEIIGALQRIIAAGAPAGPSGPPLRRKPKDPQEELREYQESMMTPEAMARDEAEGDADDPRAQMERDKTNRLDQMNREREKLFQRPTSVPKRADNVASMAPAGAVAPKARTDDIKAAAAGNKDDMLLYSMLEET